MKRFLPLCALILGLPALAEHTFTLQPGTSINVDGTTVFCAGSTNPNLPRCTVAPWGTSYSVSVDGKHWGSVATFEEAIAIATKLKQTGLCG